MLIAWMAYATLLTGILCVAAVAVERLVAIWGVAQRFVWLTVVLAAMIGPVALATRGPSLPVTSPIVIASAAGFATRGAHLVALPPAQPRTRNTGIADFAEHAIAVVDRYVGAAWIMGSALLLLLFAVALVRLSFRRRRWREATLNGMCVLIAPDVGPAVIGAARPRVVIPSWSLSLDDQARSLMLRHEAEHIAARDPLLLLIAAWSLILFPWNLGLWMAVRRLRAAIEVDCDRRVLRCSPEPRAYGMLLMAVSARRRASLPFAVALVERQSLLERRIRVMTAVPPRRRMLFSSLLAAAMLTACVAAASIPRPRSLRATALRRVATERLQLPTAVRQKIAATTRSSLGIASRRYQPRPEGSMRPVPAPVAAESLGRAVSGVVTAAGRDTPVRNAEVGTVGLQLIGAPNYTCTNDRGEFRLRVPFGDVRLEVIHADYQFRLQDLGPTDSTVRFSGARVPRDSVLIRRREVLVLQGQTKLGYFPLPIIMIDGKILSDSAVRMLRTPTRCER